MLFHSFMPVGQIPAEWKSAVIIRCIKRVLRQTPQTIDQFHSLVFFSKLMERVVVLDTGRHKCEVIACLSSQTQCELMNCVLNLWQINLIWLDLHAYLQSNNLINKQQHGLLKKRCTATNLLQSLNDWTLNLENGRRHPIAYIDFAKAFDSVSHSKLLVALAFGNWLQYRTSDFKKFICGDLSTSCKRWVNFGQITPDSRVWEGERSSRKSPSLALLPVHLSLLSFSIYFSLTMSQWIY